MKHIAVVEDEALMREELADMLRRAGYTVTEVTDFADVTGQLLALAPDLVMLDLNLPEVSGFQICRDIKQRQRRFHFVRPELHVVFVVVHLCL